MKFTGRRSGTTANTRPARQPANRLSAFATAGALVLGSLAGATIGGNAAHAGTFDGCLGQAHLDSATPVGGGYVLVGTANSHCPNPAIAVTAEVTIVGVSPNGTDVVIVGPVAGGASATASYAGCKDGPYLTYNARTTHTFTYASEVLQSANYGIPIACGQSPVPDPNPNPPKPPKPCGPNSGTDLVTIADVVAIFGTAYNTQAVRVGLPSLNSAMKAGKIDNPRRCAAFLTTLKHESRLTYNAGERGNKSTYRGRGFIQLTSKANYKAASAALGHNFVAKPSHAAAIATWYWTIARPGANTAADNLDMGLISRYIGYSKKLNPAEDLERCEDFKKALHHFSGTAVPDSVVCLRH